MPDAVLSYATWASRVGRHGTLTSDALDLREATNATERGQHGSVWALADGIGHDERAASAAQLAARTVVAHYWESTLPDPLERLEQAVQHANIVLHGSSDTSAPAASAGAATLLAAAIINNHLSVAHVGRSRLYLLRQGTLRLLTDDHTWVAQRIRAGTLTPEEALNHPNRNVITRCLGVRPTLVVDTVTLALQLGDAVLLCSDGLHRTLAEAQITALLTRERGAAAASLADAAERAGNQDDVTAVTVGISSAPSDEHVLLSRLALLSRGAVTLSAGLDLAATLRAVLEQVLVVTGGERAAIALVDDHGRLAPSVTHGRVGGQPDVGFSRSIAEAVVREGAPRLIGDLLDDTVLSTMESIAGPAVRSAMCVPLTVSGETIGVLSVDASAASTRFQDQDLDLLLIFAGQAGAALHNARLHQTLQARTAELTASTARRAALVRSLSDALIATDSAGVVTDWNPAAEALFGVPAAAAIGRALAQVAPRPVAAWLVHLMAQVETAHQTLVAGRRWDGLVASGQRLVLDGRVAIIRQDGEPRGFVFLLRDETEATRLASAHAAESAERVRLRDLLARYLAPPLVEQLLATPERVQLGGARQDISILFADLRGFTGASESQAPEAVVTMLNQFLALATDEIFAQLGTLDKFLGDGVMALFGAPVAMPDHALRAVRAAVAMRDRMAQFRRESGLRIGFGIGINSGEALVGNIGTTQLMAYTAIGDVVNVAARLQAEARTGEILIADATLARLTGQVDIEELGSTYVKGRIAPVPTFKVVRLAALA